MNKKSQLMLLLLNPLVILLIIIVILGLLFLPISPFKLSILGIEQDLKQEYTTYWGDSTDEADFTKSGSVSINDKVSASASYGVYSNVEFNKRFNGQEVVMLVSGYGTSDSAGDIGGSCAFAPYDNLGCQVPVGKSFTCPQRVITLTPSAFDNTKYNIFLDGFKVKELTLEDFQIGINCRGGGGRGSITYSIEYLGYKAEYSCDIARDEVWIQESFAQPFNIADLSFPPTKFCDDERPFVIRDLTQGEKKISLQEGIIPLNKGLTIPPRDMQVGEYITVNYATPNVAGVTNKCDVDEANIKVGGVWVCKDIVPKATPPKETILREIIPVATENSFVYSNANKGFLDIGDAQFVAIENFACQTPDSDILRPPQPSSGCYTANVNYMGNSATVADSQVLALSNNLQVQYFAQGTITSSKTDLYGTYIFTLIGKALDINIPPQQNIKHNSASSLALTLNNLLPSNTIIVKTQQRIDRTNVNLPESTKEVNVISGLNTINLPINTENLGMNEITIQAFYPIESNSQVLLPSDKIKLYILIGEDNVVVDDIVIIEEKINWLKKLLTSIIDWFKNLF